jgi:predicted ATPase/DNA-binding SARP family transcriptional activator
VRLAAAPLATDSDSRFRLYLLGQFRLEDAGRPVRLPTRKAASLLAYLALHPQPHSREHLAALLWGDVPHAQATASLRTALSSLRTRLGAEALLSDRHTVQLNPAFPLWMDAHALLAAPRAEPALAAAGEAAGEEPAAGELLPDFYDEWIVPLRERYRRLQVEHLLGQVQALRSRSEYRQAIVVAQRILEHDGGNEAAHQHLMFCYLAAGDRAEALAQYERCRASLQREYGVEPLPETTALYHWVRQAEVQAAASSGGAALPSNVPLPLSSFVGRGEEVVEVVRRLTPRAGDEGRTTTDEASAGGVLVRLLTLTGPGGCGKTRLAIQACLELLAARAFADGVWWVGLAPLAHEALAPQAVAQALGLRKAPARSVSDSLVEHLRPRQALLVLDNCEHLVGACAQLAERLLAACPRLIVLATSREALGLTGEAVVAVQPLTIPAEAAAYLLDLLLRLEAPRLFVERARAVRADLALGEASAAALASICRAVDGIPLAIELAAAQARAFSIEQIAARLLSERPLAMLTGGSRTALPRHQALRATMDWSYNLLPPDEQALFAGGWTLEAAEAVAPSALAPTAERLRRLVDKSLVVADTAGGQARYNYLDTIREYARGHLNAAGEAEAARGRHLSYFASVAKALAAAQYGSGEFAIIRQIDAEVDNLRAALRAGLELDGAVAALELACDLHRYWTVRGYWREGREWLTGLLARLEPEPSRLRARALSALGFLSWRQHDVAAAHTPYAQALEMAQALGPEAASEQAYALRGLGLLAYAERRYKEARVCFTAALALFRRHDDTTGIGYALIGLGELARTEERYDEAAGYYAEYIALRRAQGSELSATIGLYNSGQVALACGQVGRAQALLIECLAICHRFGDPHGMAEALGGVAAVEAAGGDPARAVRWFAASQTWMQTLGAALDPSDQRDFDRYLALVRQHLPPEAFAAAWAEGVAQAEAGGAAVALEALQASGQTP